MTPIAAEAAPPPAARGSALIEEYRHAFPESGRLRERARAVFPAGVTHVARALEPFAPLIERGAGSRKWTVEGRELIDYFVGHGALLLGHSHPEVVAAVQRQMALATHPGGSTRLEIEWAEAVTALVPGAERVRFTASGTEAAMMAARLARIHTGRPRLLRFRGHFHGWSDDLVQDSNPPYGTPEPGVAASHTHTVVPDDPERVDHAFRTQPDLAAVILEPTGGHWGEAPLGQEFLQALREITRRHDRLLICDEVITGFRVAPGGAQGKWGVTADLTVLAKVLAGGLPGGAVAGSAAVMGALGGDGKGPALRHPGTFNGNPLSASAGVAALHRVADGRLQAEAERIAARLRAGMNRILAAEGVPWCVYGTFSDFHVMTAWNRPAPEGDVQVPPGVDADGFCAGHAPGLVEASRLAMLLEGVDWFGLRGMTSGVHTDADVEATLHAFAGMLRRLRQDGWIS